MSKVKMNVAYLGKFDILRKAVKAVTPIDKEDQLHPGFGNYHIKH